LGTLKEWIKQNLFKKVREERVPGLIKRGSPKKICNEMVKEDMKKRSLRINDAQDKNKCRRCCRRVVDPG